MLLTNHLFKTIFVYFFSLPLIAYLPGCGRGGKNVPPAITAEGTTRAVTEEKSALPNADDENLSSLNESPEALNREVKLVQELPITKNENTLAIEPLNKANSSQEVLPVLNELGAESTVHNPALATTSSATEQYANLVESGNNVGNGGTGYSCIDEKDGKEVVLLRDFVEAKELWGLPFNINDQEIEDAVKNFKPYGIISYIKEFPLTKYEEYLMVFINRMRKIDFERSQKLSWSLNYWLNSSRLKLAKENNLEIYFSDREKAPYFQYISGHDLRVKEDVNPRAEYNKCREVNIASQETPSSPDEAYFLVNKTLFDKMPPEHQAGLVFHEILYKILLEDGVVDSYPVRALVARIANNYFSRRIIRERRILEANANEVASPIAGLLDYHKFLSFYNLTAKLDKYKLIFNEPIDSLWFSATLKSDSDIKWLGSNMTFQQREVQIELMPQFFENGNLRRFSFDQITYVKNANIFYRFSLWFTPTASKETIFPNNNLVDCALKGTGSFKPTTNDLYSFNGRFFRDDFRNSTKQSLKIVCGESNRDFDFGELAFLKQLEVENVIVRGSQVTSFDASHNESKQWITKKYIRSGLGLGKRNYYNTVDLIEIVFPFFPKDILLHFSGNGAPSEKDLEPLMLKAETNTFVGGKRIPYSYQNIEELTRYYAEYSPKRIRSAYDFIDKFWAIGSMTKNKYLNSGPDYIWSFPFGKGPYNDFIYSIKELDAVTENDYEQYGSDGSICLATFNVLGDAICAYLQDAPKDSNPLDVFKALPVPTSKTLEVDLSQIAINTNECVNVKFRSSVELRDLFVSKSSYQKSFTAENIASLKDGIITIKFLDYGLTEFGKNIQGLGDQASVEIAIFKKGKKSGLNQDECVYLDGSEKNIISLENFKVSDIVGIKKIN